MNSKKTKHIHKQTYKQKQKEKVPGEVGQIFFKHTKQTNRKQQLATFQSRIHGKKGCMRQKRLFYIEKASFYNKEMRYTTT